MLQGMSTVHHALANITPRLAQLNLCFISRHRKYLARPPTEILRTLQNPGNFCAERVTLASLGQ